MIAITQEKESVVLLYAMAQINDLLDDSTRECIDNCHDAVKACAHCADECIGKGEEMEECLRLCRDVVTVASTCAQLCASGSQFNSDIAETCTDVCEACADECEGHDHDHCQACVEPLRQCAESCRSMA